MTRALFAALLMLGLAACPDMPANPDPLPRGFSQPGSPFPYNGTGW